MFNEFDPELASATIESLCKQHKIKIQYWNKNECGRASIKIRRIKVPKPNTIMNFGVCLHEINHVTMGKIEPLFKAEFECEMFALDLLKQLNWYWYDYFKSANSYVLKHISRFINKGGSVDEIDLYIRMFFPEIDFDKWRGNKIITWYSKNSEYGYKYELILKPSITNVRSRLNDMGLLLKLGSDGIYEITGDGFDLCRKLTFSKLSRIIDYFRL